MKYILTFIGIVLAFAAFGTGDTSNKDNYKHILPEDVPLFNYAIIFCISIFGGFIHFLHKVKRGVGVGQLIFEMIKDIGSSLFVGIITAWLCQEAHFSWTLTAALTGIAAHMGTRLLFLYEKILKDRLNLPEEK